VRYAVFDDDRLRRKGENRGCGGSPGCFRHNSATVADGRKNVNGNLIPLAFRGWVAHTGGEMRRTNVAGSLVMLVFMMWPAQGEDWPEWRGKGRTGVWNETGVVERFPDKGLRARWRVPIRAGFAGPAVAAGRVFVTDFEKGAGSGGVERLVCLDETTVRFSGRESGRPITGESATGMDPARRRRWMAIGFTPWGQAVCCSA